MNLIFIQGGDIDKSELTEITSYKMLMDKINIRLNRKYTASKVKWIWKIQGIFTDYDKPKEEVYQKVCKELKFTIEGKAKALERRYRSVRLSYHDFEAELWKITYEALEYYEEAGDIESEFMLIETLELWWANRMKSFIKSCLYTKKNSPWYFASTLNEYQPDTAKSLEDAYILKEAVAELLNDTSLTDKERSLLEAIYDNPEGSYREWGKEIGVTHPETVKRLFINTQKKLSKYRNQNPIGSLCDSVG